MISTPLRPKLFTHTRSASLPSRSHPLIPQFNDHLQKLNNVSNDSTSLSSITNKLDHLQDLYNCVDDLLLLPHTRQVFAHECVEKWVQHALDGYLGLVDACATAKDSVSYTKEHLQELLSALRRRRDLDDLSGFIVSRKVVKKMIHKYLRCISSSRNKSCVLALDKDQETIAIISMLKEAESITMELIEALLLSIAGMKAHSRGTGWSFVSRLIHSRKVLGHQRRDTLEFEDLEALLYKLASFRTPRFDTSVLNDELHQQLREMDSNIRVVEETLECLFKRLVRTRVSLLNLQSQQ